MWLNQFQKIIPFFFRPGFSKPNTSRGNANIFLLLVGFYFLEISATRIQFRKYALIISKTFDKFQVSINLVKAATFVMMQGLVV